MGQVTVRLVTAFAVLCLANHIALATPEQCAKAIQDRTISGIENYCAYLKTSDNRIWRKLYHHLLGLAYMQAWNSARSEILLLRQALENLNAAVAIVRQDGASPDDADIYQTRGLIYLQSGDSGSRISEDAGKALSDFDMAVSLMPTKALHYLYRGYAHNQLLDIAAAWADFQRARALDPRDPEVRAAWEKQRRIMPAREQGTRRGAGR